MVNTQQVEQSAGAGSSEEIERFDAIVIGAGVTGLYALYRLRQLGLTAKSFEEGSGVGGTWFWNRYPGCRFDSESYTYGYSFSEELLQEWDWKEHYSGQPENERYLNYVADKFDLRPHIRLNSRVMSAVFDEDDDRWLVQLEDGHQARGRFLITSVGILSAGYTPDFDGIDSFKGPWCHTGRWPKEGMDLAGKRVGVIGTGATGVQVDADLVRAARPDGRPLAIIDLALPHDVDPAAAEVPGVTLVNLAELAAGLHESEAGVEIAAVRSIVTEEVSAFLTARRQASVTPTVVALRSMATSVVAAEMTRLDGRLPDLDPMVRAEVLHAVRRVADKLLHEPTVRVRELANETGAVSYAAALAELFALDPDAVTAVTSPSVPEEKTR